MVLIVDFVMSFCADIEGLMRWMKIVRDVRGEKRILISPLMIYK
jgi:hypothetical protein